MTDHDKRILWGLYLSSGVPRDSLPYSTEFDAIWACVVRHLGRHVSPNEVWRELSVMAGSAAERDRLGI